MKELYLLPPREQCAHPLSFKCPSTNRRKIYQVSFLSSLFAHLGPDTFNASLSKYFQLTSLLQSKKQSSKILTKIMHEMTSQYSQYRLSALEENSVPRKTYYVVCPHICLFCCTYKHTSTNFAKLSTNKSAPLKTERCLCFLIYGLNNANMKTMRTSEMRKHQCHLNIRS